MSTNPELLRLGWELVQAMQRFKVELLKEIKVEDLSPGLMPDWMKNAYTGQYIDDIYPRPDGLTWEQYFKLPHLVDEFSDKYPDSTMIEVEPKGQLLTEDGVQDASRVAELEAIVSGLNEHTERGTMAFACLDNWDEFDDGRAIYRCGVCGRQDKENHTFCQNPDCPAVKARNLTLPSAPQATIPAPAGVDYRLEPIGWQTGLRVDPAGFVHEGVVNRHDFVRVYCPFGCRSSDVYDKAVFTLRKVIKCRQCKRSFEVKRMDDVHLWKAIDDEETHDERTS